MSKSKEHGDRLPPLLVVDKEGNRMICTWCNSAYHLPLSGAQAERAMKLHAKCRAERAAKEGR